MSKKQKIVLRALIAFAAVTAVAPASNAMHIMEGYLPAGYCIAWGVICLPFLFAGFLSLKQEEPDIDRHVRCLYFRDFIA